MTALVAVMNKLAVALAGDSAGTVQLPGREHHKIYAMNKVFALSKVAPVGVMICGESQYLGLPWESIIKAYRRTDPTRNFKRLGDWKDDFLNYLAGLVAKVPQAQRDGQILSRYEIVLNIILDKLKESGHVTTEAVSKTLEAQWGLEIQRLTKPSLIQDSERVDPGQFLKRNRETLESRETAIFAKRNLQPLDLSSCRPALIEVLLTRQPPSGAGGSKVVVTGFGTEDWFPSLRSFHVDGASDALPRIWEDVSCDITWESPANIVPFAQADIVWTLLHGIDPQLEDRLGASVRESFVEKLPELIGDVLKQHIADEARRVELTTTITALSDQLYREITGQLKQYSFDRHTLPVLASIQHLGKGELAQLAESLITTTSLKYRMAIDAQESVGGPVDVAVISREEGFIWIRRKHYFDMAINPSFRDQQSGF